MKYVIAALLLAGCAQLPERYFTAEEDARLREICEPAGCVIITTPVWEQIKAIIRRLGNT